MSDPESLPVKEILTVATPFIKSIVDTYVTPQLARLKKRIGKDYNKYHVPTAEHFSEYFYRTYKRISIVNTLVFNNSQRFLKEIYLPLTLIKKDVIKEKSYKITNFPSLLLETHDKVLITDNAGMGKSTLIKKIFLDSIDSKKGVPLLIELRRLSKDKTIVNEIHEQINALNNDFDGNLLIELLAEGGFIILLDGYDEIPLSDREIVTADIQSFINKASKNIFILTSRPENALKGFGEFQEFTIEPLKKKEAFELLRKYDKQGPISKLLIKKLEESGMVGISEFLTNPLLVSLLFTAFQHKQTIPFKKHIFYRQVYDANFECHDLTKGESYIHDKYSKLAIDDFHRVLRHIGFSCLKDNQRIEFSKDDILLLINNSKTFCADLSFTASDFLKDLLSTVPLFTQDGNYYRWAHKSLQEYFAAQFIYLDTKHQQTIILKQLYNSVAVDKYINILDLYYDIDTKTFRSNILFDLLKDYYNHFHSTYKGEYKGIKSADITNRKELCFLCEPYIFTIPSTMEKNRLDADRLDLMISKYKDKKISGRLTSHTFESNVYCFIINDPKEAVCQLLSNKLPQIFKPLHMEVNQEHKSVMIKHHIKDDYIPYGINEKVKDFVNSKTNFSKINEVIKHAKFRSIQVDTNHAFALLEEIEAQVLSEKSENFLLVTE